ncbi:unnamed protein product [Oppiella nova]|uniref:Protein kinase domain-containing protein n=1 Tax=Oppiella nova TaxID=334625 RepID=A0A7R9LR88_9ACAR|nr:unnamed protein product [Oppiella nova]CAG2166185.1 unnamed protein product [Oppiella nova]
MRSIGKGSFGEVFKVQKNYNIKKYAIKISDLSGRNISETDKQNMLDETKKLIRERSKYVVEYFNSWIQNNCLYIQMELCHANLKGLLKIKRNISNGLPGVASQMLDLYLSIEIFLEITECVQYLHRDRIIHRDLKPDNVLVGSEEMFSDKHCLKLCDFGLAKIAVNIDLFNMTGDVGDAQYMAPEAMANVYDHRIDIYSLAIIGAEIFGFDKKEIILGNDKQITNQEKNLQILSEEIQNLFVLMSINEYRRNGSTDWRERPECVDILSQLRLIRNKLFDENGSLFLWPQYKNIIFKSPKRDDPN